MLLALNLAVLSAAGATAILRDDRPDAADLARSAGDEARASGDAAAGQPGSASPDGAGAGDGDGGVGSGSSEARANSDGTPADGSGGAGATTPSTDDGSGASASGGATAAAGGQGERELALGDLSDVIEPAAMTNVDVAVALSQAAFPDGGAPDAIVARDDGWVDALTSAGVQGALDAPLLLTPGGTLDQAVVDEMERLGTERVQIVGGPEAVDVAVEQQLADLGLDVTRLAGSDRVDTSVRLAEQHLPDATTALLVRSEHDEDDLSRGFVDALAAGGWAASSGMPVLLTRPFVLDDVVARYLERSAIERVIVIGGREAVEDQVEDQLAATGVGVERVFGVDRYDTAVQIARAQGLTEGADRALLVEGDGDQIWAAGFASASYAKRAGAPILLAADGTVPRATDAVLSASPGLQLVCAPGVAEAACATAQELALSGE